MIKNYLLKKTAIPSLTKGLDVYALRQKTTAANIANVETPGYRRKYVEFEEHLQNALENRLSGRRTEAKHLPVGRSRVQEAQPRIVEDDSAELLSGVNNVDIDREVVEQIKNQIRYQYGARLLNKDFSFLRASIKGRFDQ
ncbi:MAG: flagellar basal body rod protein FlgB [Calditrichia bacterium]